MVTKLKIRGDDESDLTDEDREWAHLTFQCIAAGSSNINVDGKCTLWETIIFRDLDPDVITVTQQAAPQRVVRNNPVGGVILPVNELAVLVPYLALIGLVASLYTIYLVKKKQKS